MSDDDRWPPFLADGEDEPAPSREPEEAAPGHRRRSHTAARVTHAFGEVLLTVGAVLLLFVAYTLWWTGVETGNQQDQLQEELEEQFAEAEPQPGVSVTPGTEPPPGLADVEIGDAVAALRIPRFGPGYAWVVVEGIDLDNLARGPGHYPQTSMPGEIGNFAVAGHRATHGEPFANFDQLQIGDPVVVETATQWYTYEIVEIDYPVPISSGWALDPNPLALGTTPTKSMLTMTTCHPRWASTFRFLVFSELVNTTPRVDAAGVEQLPPALEALEG